MSFLLTIFLALNVAFLFGTAIWFRTNHATPTTPSSSSSSSFSRFDEYQKEELIDEVMWQYSLRSNLLVWGGVLASYLIYINKCEFLLVWFAIFSIINIVTDTIYQYPQAPPLFYKVQKGHQIAAIVIWIVLPSITFFCG